MPLWRRPAARSAAVAMLVLLPAAAGTRVVASDLRLVATHRRRRRAQDAPVVAQALDRLRQALRAFVHEVAPLRRRVRRALALGQRIGDDVDREQQLLELVGVGEREPVARFDAVAGSFHAQPARSAIMARIASLRAPALRRGGGHCATSALRTASRPPVSETWLGVSPVFLFIARASEVAVE